MHMTPSRCFFFLLGVYCMSCSRRTPSEDQLSAAHHENDLETQDRRVTIEYQGQTLSALIPEGFADQVVHEDTFLLPGGVRRTGTAYFYAAGDAVAYIGAFALPEMSEKKDKLSGAILFENAIRDGATISQQATKHSGERYLLSFPNGDNVVVDVKLIWRSSVLFVVKSIQLDNGVHSPSLEAFLLSAR